MWTAAQGVGRIPPDEGLQAGTAAQQAALLQSSWHGRTGVLGQHKSSVHLLSSGIISFDNGEAPVSEASRWFRK